MVLNRTGFPRNFATRGYFQAGVGMLPVLVFCGGCALLQPCMPPGTCCRGLPAPANVRFVGDVTFVNEAGARVCEQRILDTMLDAISRARTLVVADMFLYNEWIGRGAAPYRRTAAAFTKALIAKKQRCPRCTVVLITDPINTLYGGDEAPLLERLRAVGVIVVITDLNRLRDSNPAYSFWWRLLISPFGNRPGGILPNPFGPGHVTLRTYLALLNFKANHRKVLICDPDGRLEGMVTSLNPHDGSSAHTNAAIFFDGPAVRDLLATEQAVAALSGTPLELPGVPVTDTAGSSVTVQVVTERGILDAVLDMLDRAGPGDRADLIMFYLAHRNVIAAIEKAYRRGVELRVVLDPNKDAFGRIKNGIPNRQVAWELHRLGIPVRWYDTHGEQCHTKMLLLRYRDGSAALLAGSANFTRRNLDNFNLETDVVVRGPGTATAFQDATEYMDDIWFNRKKRHCTVPFKVYEDASWLKRLRYRFMEWSGFSTF